jgi:hypothetical protein
VRKRPESFLAIDPGNVQSAYLVWEPGKPVWKMRHGILLNDDLLQRMDYGHYVGGSNHKDDRAIYTDHVVIEMPEDMGRSDDSLFETAFWAGVFAQGWNEQPYTLIYRHQVKSHLKAQDDSGVRAALIRRFGKCVETEFAYDEWSSLAIAVTFDDYCQVVF